MYSSYFGILFLGGKDRKKGFQRGAKKNERMKKILISGYIFQSSFLYKKEPLFTFSGVILQCELSAVYLRRKLIYGFIFGSLALEIVN